MKQKGKVTKIADNGIAAVEVLRMSACDGCHKSEEGCIACTLSGGKKTMTVDSANSAGASVGDSVLIETDGRRVLLFSFLLFLTPVILGLCLYFIGNALFGEAVACISAIVGCIADFVLLAVLFNTALKKQFLSVDIVEIIEAEPYVD